MVEPILLEFEKPLAELEQRMDQIRIQAQADGVNVTDQLAQLEGQIIRLRVDLFERLSPYQRLQVARHPQRPSTLDYFQTVTDDWLELRGDRCFGDDLALVGGLARIGDFNVVILGHQKGRDTKDNIKRNFGMPQPEGYRKALRLMQHADRFGLPIISFIDTPGAYPGVQAEERGQGEALARNIREMFHLGVPILCTVIGEGGSGGALAIGVGNRVFMLENAVYSVIAPESCSSILWRDTKHAEEAANALKITARDLKRLGIVDDIIPEPVGGAHRSPIAMAHTLKQTLIHHLKELTSQSPEELRAQRYEKFRRMGAFLEAP
nr:acetyl-CoA carboxylase carboxyltransferase subunit alpha [Candidatus Cyanaurora vandensis]